MKPVEIFYLPGCPYCVKAKKAAAELKDEDERYSHIPLKLINEEEETDYAENHDYYYVPTAFVNDKKIFEAKPGDSFETIKAGIQEAFEKALKS